MSIGGPSGVFGNFCVYLRLQGFFWFQCCYSAITYEIRTLGDLAGHGARVDVEEEFMPPFIYRWSEVDSVASDDLWQDVDSVESDDCGLKHGSLSPVRDLSKRELQLQPRSVADAKAAFKRIKVPIPVYHGLYHQGKCIIGASWNVSEVKKKPQKETVDHNRKCNTNRLVSRASGNNDDEPRSPIPLKAMVVEKVALFLSPDTRWVVIKSDMTGDYLRQLNANIDAQMSNDLVMAEVVASSIKDPVVLLGWQIELLWPANENFTLDTFIIVGVRRRRLRPCNFLLKKLDDDWDNYRFHKDIGSRTQGSSSIPIKESEVWTQLRRKPNGGGCPFKLVCRVATVSYVVA